MPTPPQAPVPSQNVYMSPVQKKLHDQLQQKARQVQDAIRRQQEELRTITEQLSFAKQGAIPMVNQPQVADNGIMSSPMPMLGDPNIPPGDSQSMVPMVSMATHNTIMMDQSSFMPFPVMSHDTDLLLSHTDSADSPLPSGSHQQ